LSRALGTLVWTLFRPELNPGCRGLISVISKVKPTKAPPGLAQGQVWRLNHAYIQIVELGQRLLHYRMLEFLGQKGVRTQVSGIEVMWQYLKSRGARLVRGGAAA
jgi:hypothetical protein